MKVISKKLTRKILEMLRKVAEVADNDEDDEFGEALKGGCFEDDANRSKLLKLLRFQTSSSDGKLVSLQSYVDRMPEHQKKIYFVSGDDVKAMLKTPHMQMFNKKKIEVLLFTGQNDEHVIQKAQNFEGKHFASVHKDDI